MLLRILKTIWNLLLSKFRPDKGADSYSTATYELVETKLDEEHFRQGIKILGGKYNRVVVTTSPKIQFKHDGDQITMLFDYVIEYHPPELEIDHTELRPIVGDIILDIIHKDTNAPRTPNSEHSREE